MKLRAAERKHGGDSLKSKAQIQSSKCSRRHSKGRIASRRSICADPEYLDSFYISSLTSLEASSRHSMGRFTRGQMRRNCPCPSLRTERLRDCGLTRVSHPTKKRKSSRLD